MRSRGLSTCATLRALLVPLVIWVGAGSGGASSGAEPTRIRIGTSGDYPPFSERAASDPDAPPSFRGFEIDLATEWARARGREIEWVPFHWPRLIDDLAAGRFDVAMSGVTVRPERSAAGRYTVPIVQTSAVVLLRDPGRRNLRRLDRPDVRIGVNAGGHLEQVARAHFPRATLLAISGNAGVIEALIADSVEAVVTETHEARLWLERVPGSGTKGPLTRDRKAWLVRPDRADLAADLDAWLLASEADGTLARLREEHLGSPGPATAEPLSALLAALDERLSLMPIVGAAKREEGIPLEVPEREQVVLDAAVEALLAAAAAADRSPPAEADVRHFFRVQMDAAKEVQWRAVQEVDETPEPPYPDLDTALRPGLLRIGERIAWLLVRLPPDTEASRVRALVAQEVRAPHLSGASRRGLADALTRLVPETPGMPSATAPSRDSPKIHDAAGERR